MLKKLEELSLTDEYLHKTYLEGVKLRFDLVKHLTTLSTGALLLLVTIIEKLFKAPEWKALVVLSMASFLVSIVFSVFWMAGLAYKMEGWGRMRGTQVSALSFSASASMASFLSGLAALAAFATKNFFQ